MPDERGVHADAARAREATLVQRLRAATAADRALTAALADARGAASRASRRLDVIQAEVDGAVAGQRALALGTPAGARSFSAFLAAKARDVHRVIADAAADDAARANLAETLGRRYATDDPGTPTVQAVDNRTHAPGPAAEGDRRQHQLDAFRQVFGREPVSAIDWTTAAVLDANTYDPEYRGFDSEVRVAGIDPVPGQGVVRVSQWIPQRDVKSGVFARNFGNDRGPDPHFDPAHTKVTTYIDYENGVVVMRQNPSVEQNHDGTPGQVRVGAPIGSVTQAGDGSVRIRYDAGNPFAPGLSTDPHGPLAGHRLSVNGDLVFTPGATGVHVDGTRTNYPSMEVYQDLPDDSTRTVLIDPARSGSSVGPVFNLPRHHDVGLGGFAFEPFDSGKHTGTPLPTIAFEPVTVPLPMPAPPGLQVRAPA